MKNNKGFSLIELSIVLIIIGLLVAGVTGGASLIESARTTALMNEIRGYQTAVSVFYAAKERLPGDPNKTGKFGDSINNFTTSSFGAPYNTAGTIPESSAAPWVDLYLEGILDFKPTTYGGQMSVSEEYQLADKSFPKSTVFKADYYYKYGTINTNSYVLNHHLYGMGSKVNVLSLNFNTAYDIAPIEDSYRIPSMIKAKIFKRIDDKLDDGVYNKGKFRANCLSATNSYYSNYASSIAANNGCKSAALKLEM